MVTKAELEAEIAELRRQLAEQPPAKNASPDKGADAPPHETIADRLTDNLESWSTQLDDILEEFEDLPHRKSILFAAGIFALGYMLGRSR